MIDTSSDRSAADATSSDGVVLRFARPMPGFEGAPRSFAVEPWGGEGSPFALLRCHDDPELAFVVVHPAVFFPDYEPELDDATVELLGLRSADDVLVYVILTLGGQAHDTTANLLGPIVVNRHTGAAVQAVLHAPELPTKAPLVAA